MTDKLIYSRWTYRFENPEDEEPTRIDESEYCSQYSPGDTYVTFAGAPGCGRTVYEVTRVDEDGIWGVVQSDTVRILTPGEVF